MRLNRIRMRLQHWRQHLIGLCGLAITVKPICCHDRKTDCDLVTDLTLVRRYIGRPDLGNGIKAIKAARGINGGMQPQVDTRIGQKLGGWGGWVSRSSSASTCCASCGAWRSSSALAIRMPRSPVGSGRSASAISNALGARGARLSSCMRPGQFNLFGHARYSGALATRWHTCHELFGTG